MGYLYTLPKARCFLGDDIMDAYHSIDMVSLANAQVSITVGVYPSRDAKYARGLLERNQRLAPAYLIRALEEDMPQESDVASSTSVSFSPVRPAYAPLLGAYNLVIDADALFPTGIPYDLTGQRESLYPTIKRLLGMEDAVDVIETIEDFDTADLLPTDDV